MYSDSINTSIITYFNFIYFVFVEHIPNSLSLLQTNAFQTLAKIYQLSITITNYTLTHPVMTAFLADKDEHFDLIVVEASILEALYGLGPHFKAPIVGFSTHGSSASVASLVGTPAPISYVPHLVLTFSDRMSFVQRLVNGLVTIFEHVALAIHYQYQTAIFDAVFKEQRGLIREARRSVALVLVNQHFSTNFPRPYVPNMIEVGGIQINRDEPRPLPHDIRAFVDGADHGVIYLSLGTNIRSADLPPDVRRAIVRTIGKLKQRVLWKWEDTELPDRPDNLLIRKWYPQDDVLAHPKVLMFITHGGLLGVSEAVYHGLPIIGIPFFGDQLLNLARARSQGFGLTVEYTNLTETSLAWAIDEMLANPTYAQQARLMSARYRDQPIRPLDLAKYWVEYVARHKGAPHIQSAGMDLSFLQYHGVDVFAVLATSVVLFSYLIWLACGTLCCRRKPTHHLSTNVKSKQN